MTEARKAEASRFRLRDLWLLGFGLLIATYTQAPWLAFFLAGVSFFLALWGCVLIWAEWVLDKANKKE